MSEQSHRAAALLDDPGWGLHFDAQGLVPVVAQDACTRDVLILGSANQEAVQRSLDTGDAWFWSRGRQELWHKGATSGHFLRLRRIRRNCEDNSLLYEVEPLGPACHMGPPGCFFRDLAGTGLPPLSAAERASNSCTETGVGAESLLDAPGWGLHFNAQGLVPVVAQDVHTRDVLMLAFANQGAVQRSLDTGDAWFWSRSRQELWHKGATSGHFLRLRRIRRDCEDNSLLYEVEPVGPACHTGRPGCFFRDLAGIELPPLSAEEHPPTAAAPTEMLESVFEVILERQRTKPAGSYVATLLDQGLDRIAKKVGEEAAEVIIAAKNRDRAQVAHEVADLWFHTLVLLAEQGMTPADVTAVLAERRGGSASPPGPPMVSG